MTAEKKSIYFTEQYQNFCFSLHCNGVNIFFYLLMKLKYANLKQKILKNAVPLFLRNVSKKYLVDYMKKTE